MDRNGVNVAGTSRSWILVLACCGAVAAVVLFHALPMARAGCCLTPDAVGYLATAHNWVEGAGFVDPILYTHYLPDARPPVPAIAIRPPALSVLMAPALALGAGVAEMLLLHAIWAALIAAAAVLAARRAMSLPAATGFAIALTWSSGWMFVSSKPLTEVTAVGFLLLAVVSLRAGTASVRGALLFSLLTLTGWLVRPNLALVLPAAVLAVVCEQGPRAALRSRPLQVYVGSFALLYGAVFLTVTLSTGFAPYAHYGVMAEIIETNEVFLYQKQYVGWLAYLQGNSDAVLEALRINLRKSYELLFLEDFYLWVGWLAAPGLVFALWRSGEAALERRFVAFAGLGFTAVALATYGGFTAQRYLLLGVVCAWFAVMSMASDGSAWISRGVAAARGGGSLRLVPLCLPTLLVLALFLGQADTRPVRDPWRHWQQAGAQYLPLCGQVDRDALVASVNPWWFYLWCGNAGLRLPTDLEDVDGLHRYLDEQQPAYLLGPRSRAWYFLARSPRLEHLGNLERKAPRPALGLYAVVDAGPASRTWQAPPPLGSRTEVVEPR